MSFTLYIRAEDAKLRSAAASPPVNTPNMAGVPAAYHDFADVFSKAKATTLAPHRKYDQKMVLSAYVSITED